MKTEKIYLLNDSGANEKDRPDIVAYIPEQKISDCAFVIFPGGGYGVCSAFSGEAYAEYFVERGFTCFVVHYRVYPNEFPKPIADGQRAMQLVRYNAEKWGINANKLLAIGSSAGAHLAATLCTYREFLANADDEIAKTDFLPNAQVLCYGVLNLANDYAHKGSGKNLLGDRFEELAVALSPDLIADEKTPPAFVWHTMADDVVPVENALEYVKRLSAKKVKTELHIFPDGFHGKGLSQDNDKVSVHKRQWLDLFFTWLKYMDFLA